MLIKLERFITQSAKEIFFNRIVKQEIQISISTSGAEILVDLVIKKSVIVADYGNEVD